MSSPRMLSADQLKTLIALLEERLSVIGDHELREQNPEEQLRRIQQISEAIMTFHAANRDSIPPRLNHFLENSSLEKALDWSREALSQS